MLNNHLSTSKTGLELTTDKLNPGAVHVQKKRTHSLNHLNIDLTPSINLLLPRSPCPEQRSLCSPVWRVENEGERGPICCKSFETDGGHRFSAVVHNSYAYQVSAPWAISPRPAAAFSAERHAGSCAGSRRSLLWHVRGIYLNTQNSSLRRIQSKMRSHISPDVFQGMKGWWQIAPGADFLWGGGMFTSLKINLLQLHI